MNLALFDLDYTLLDGDSDHAWGEFLAGEGVVDGAEYRRKNDEFWDRYKNGTLDIQEFLAFALAPLASRPVDELKKLHDRYLENIIAPMITDAARALVAGHRQDLCAIVTATNAFVTRPIAERFGIPHLIASEAELKDGRYTGRPTGVPSFREGKVTRVEQWLADEGKRLTDFPRSFFYSDSMNDLPLLDIVTDPVAVDPDARLRAHAELRGWPIISLKQSDNRRS
jgi:HAD superfamily hydrolase (TIGR01490 family)